MAEVVLDAVQPGDRRADAFPMYPLGHAGGAVAGCQYRFLFPQGVSAGPTASAPAPANAPSSQASPRRLHIANGDTINPKLQSKSGIIQQLLDQKASDDKVVEGLYLSALSRYPTDVEKARVLAALQDQQGTDRREVLEDLYWGVLSSNQFLFNR